MDVYIEWLLFMVSDIYVFSELITSLIMINSLHLTQNSIIIFKSAVISIMIDTDMIRLFKDNQSSLNDPITQAEKSFDDNLSL